jgi:hypothetical protein
LAFPQVFAPDMRAVVLSRVLNDQIVLFSFIFIPLMGFGEMNNI